MQSPLVSILIPSYKPQHFRQTLLSAMAQTYYNTEIIVSDDCPNEKIYDICQEYSNFLTYVRNPNPGVLGLNNIKHLLSLAKGEFIKYLFDDDILDPFCVQYMLDAYLRNQPNNPSLVFSPRNLIDVNGKYIKTLNILNLSKETLIPGANLERFIIHQLTNPVGEFSTVLFRKDACFNQDGSSNLYEYRQCPIRGLVDVALWLHLSTQGSILFVPYILSHFRSHESSNTNPDINPEHLLIITDWGVIQSIAFQSNVLVDINARKECLEKLVTLYKTWTRTYPQLSIEANKMRIEIDNLNISNEKF